MIKFDEVRETLEIIIQPDIFAFLVEHCKTNDKKRTVENLRIMARKDLFVEHRKNLNLKKKAVEKAQEYLLQPRYPYVEEMHSELDLDLENDYWIEAVNKRRVINYRLRPLTISEHKIYIEE